MSGPRGVRPLEIGIASALLIALASTGSRRTRSAASFRADAGDVQLNASGDIRLSTGGTLFEIVGRAGPGEELADIRVVRDARGVVLENIALAAVVDGAPMRLVADRPRTTPDGPTHASAHVELRGLDGTLDADLGYTLRRSPAALVVSLKLRSVQSHSVALVMNAPARAMVPFVRGIGMLADSGDAQGPLVVLESAHEAAAVGSVTGVMDVHVGPSEDTPEAPLSVSITFPPGPAGDAPPFFLLIGSDPSGVAEAAARLRNEPVRHLHGRVVGGVTGVDVWGVGPDGRPLSHAKPRSDGTFDTVAPPVDLGFYATMAHTRASPIVPRPLHDDSELELNMLPGGEAHVRVEDADTGRALTARLIVHGVAPTADPNFGPDYRSSGAGPLMDALRGEATMPLPTGRYRVLATRGPEYTIDEQEIDVPPGSSHSVRLALRHVVDTPGWVSCDLHVHARPSFDSPVLPEDRVISLIAAGVDFAVPSEHNAVGHYDAVLEALELTGDLASVPGVEITTARPNYGHFNVFPYPGPSVPPFRRTTLKQIFTKAREGDPTRVLQVNHPRLKGIGYFDIVGLDTKTGHAERDWRDDFDAIEVYNGADGAHRARVESVLLDWLRLVELGHRYVGTGASDSHRIQYQWAGYPRTYVALGPDQAGETGKPIDKAALVASLKAGRAFVTSGPVVEASINGQGPGGTVALTERVARLHVAVRATPWIDVSEVEVLLGATPVARAPVPPFLRQAGSSERRELAAARAATLRFERDFDVPFDGNASTFVVVIVRGAHTLDEVLPYMPIQPLAFTNPIWLTRPSAPSAQN